MNAAAVVVFLLVSAGYLEFELKNLILADASRDLETRAYLVRDRLADAGPEGLQPAVEQAAAQSGARVTVFSADGTALADSESRAAEMGGGASGAEFKQALEEGVGTSQRFSQSRQKDYLFVALADKNPAGTRVVRVGVPMSQLLGRLELLRSTLWFTGIVLLLAGMGLSYVIARYIVRPIEVMRTAAQRLARGDFTFQMDLNRKDEFGQLMAAFNAMGRELQNRVTQLEANRREMSTIMENMAEGLLLVDAAGNVVLANRAAAGLLGTEAEVLRGKPLWEMVRLPQVDELLSSLPNLKEPRRIWVEDRTHGSQRRVLGFVATPLFETASGIQHAVLLISDATEDQKLLEMRQDFVANVSHELKTPLTSISAYVETLLDGAARDESVRVPFLQKIQANTTRLSKLVSDILNLSRLESGTGDESRQQLDLNDLAQACVDKHREAASAKGLKLQVHRASEPVHGLVNEEDMTEALDNLVVNAISYTPAGGSVDVTARRTETGVQLEVKDTGCGIPREALLRVFERFYRVDKARSRALGGTGLGLAIVKHVAIKHGGKVEAESEEGLGSTFRITLPPA